MRNYGWLIGLVALLAVGAAQLGANAGTERPSKVEVIAAGVEEAGKSLRHVAWLSVKPDGNKVRRELKLEVEALAKIIAAGIYWPLQEDCETFKNCPQVIRHVIGFGKRGDDGVWRTSQWTGADWPNACGAPFDYLVIADEVPAESLEICPAVPVDHADAGW